VRRREVITLLGGAATWPVAARAQKPGRTYRLGLLIPLPREAPINVAVFDEMRRRDVIEGQNLTVEYREYGQHPDRISEYAAELVKARVDVIVTAGSHETIRAAQQATKTIPIVGMAEDLVGSGLVRSMARPNGNTTGVSVLATTLDGKRQEILIEAVPGLRRMAFLVDTNTIPVSEIEAMQEAARAHKTATHLVAKGEEIAAAIESAKASGATALNISASPLFYSHRQLILDRVAALRLPTIYEWPETAQEGGFAAYGPRLDDIVLEVMLRQIVQLLRGIKVADIPVEQPTKFELVINLKAANAMGLQVPPALLLRADKVIE
jgi:putative ABC transport system substrate-binding protein